MNTVVTLIRNPAGPELGRQDLAPVHAILQRRGAGFVSNALSRRALDLELQTEIPDRLLLTQEIQEALRNRQIDVIVQPAANRKKRLLVADMDSTIIGQECIDELADFAGKRAEISEITGRAMRGELDFEGALIERVSMLKGLPASVLEEAYAKKITLNPGARTLVKTMQKFGGKCALVSGGFTFFTARVAAAAGFDAHEANELLIENGALTGDVARPIKGREAKEKALIRLAGDYGFDLSETLAIGDGANDLAMLARAGLGVAYHAKPAVAAAAHARIDHGDLTALLYLQGIPQAEFSD